MVVYERSHGKISGLNCREHNMVLPGYALMAASTQVHIATWPGQNHPGPRHILLSRAFGSQAACYVIDVDALLSYEKLREDQKEYVGTVREPFRYLVRDYPGESCIVDPRGEIVGGPAEGEIILIADCSIENVYSAKGICDLGGHYSRPDVFELLIHRSCQSRITDVNH